MRVSQPYIDAGMSYMPTFGGNALPLRVCFVVPELGKARASECSQPLLFVRCQKVKKRELVQPEPVRVVGLMVVCLSAVGMGEPRQDWGRNP